MRSLLLVRGCCGRYPLRRSPVNLHARQTLLLLPCLAFLPGLQQCEETCFDFDEQGNRIEFQCVTCVERDENECTADTWRLPSGSMCALGQQPILDDGTPCAAPGGQGYCFSAACEPAPEQLAYLKSDPIEAAKAFGYVMAMDGDTIVVGANAITAGTTDDVHVFVREDDGWVLEAVLEPLGFASQFGTEVAIDGDTIVVGGSQYAGVFVREAGSWAEQASLAPEGPYQHSSSFGRSGVSVSGDTVVVSASTHDGNGASSGIYGDPTDVSISGAGSIYVFVRNGTVWTQQAHLRAPNPDENDSFGRAVVDGDTLVAVAINEGSGSPGPGADQHDNSVPRSGAAYVYQRFGTVWRFQEYIKASNPDQLDQFGSQAALSGDLLAVAASGEDSAATGIDGDDSDNSVTDSGAVFIFARAGADWTQQAYIKASNTGTSDRFGRDVDLHGERLLVGAWQENSAAIGIDGDQSDDSSANSGAAYLFTSTEGEWTQRRYIKASNTGDADKFGSSVAIDGVTFAVGALGERSGDAADESDDSTVGSGAVYVFGIRAESP